MTYVILRIDQGGGWLHRAGAYAWTHRLQHAWTFSSRAEAEKERCPGNEIVQTLEEAMNGGQS